MGVGLFVSVWIARYLGPEEFGLLNFATAFVALFGAIAGLGLRGIVVRDIVHDLASKEEILGTAAVLQFVGGLIAYAISLGVIFWLRPDDVLAKVLVAILGSMMLFKVSEVAVYWFESQVLSKYTVWVQNVSFLIFTAIKVVLILNQAPIIAFAWAAMAEALMAALLLGVMLGVKGPGLRRLQVTLTRAKSLIKDSWPLLFSGILVSINLKFDQIMITEIVGEEANGMYAVAAAIPQLIIGLLLLLEKSLYPTNIASFNGELCSLQQSLIKISTVSFKARS